MKTSEKLESVLCNPDGQVVSGSAGDNEIIQETIQEVKDLETYARHIHRNKQDGSDTCALCNFDLRHNIHFRYKDFTASRIDRKIKEIQRCDNAKQ